MAQLESRAAPPPHVRGAFFAALLLCLPGLLVTLKLSTEPELEAADPYMVNLQPERLAGVVAAVPASAVMGYLTDLEPGSTADLAAHNNARYTLAPRLLTRGAQHEWVLGNFGRPADFAALGRARGLQLVRDFGNGVVLYKGSTR